MGDMQPVEQEKIFYLKVVEAINISSFLVQDRKV